MQADKQLAELRGGLRAIADYYRRGTPHITDIAERSLATIARLQEQVETLRRQAFIGFQDAQKFKSRAEAAEAERDRLREALHLVGMSAGYQYMTMETRALIDAALQKEPQT